MLWQLPCLRPLSHQFSVLVVFGKFGNNNTRTISPGSFVLGVVHCLFSYYTRNPAYVFLWAAAEKLRQSLCGKVMTGNLSL